ncbi:MAG: VCBS repeat-containing protein, partial [Chloroflexi bacterium]|nr:VCBS repeat-containing protein [Chloroflexota bacterium]
PQRPTTSELRGLSAYDLDGDDTLEIVVTAAVGNKTNTWVYEHDGTLRPGWPQLVGDSGYAYGVFNDNAAVGDLDGDSMGEVVIPSDVHYICAYEATGAPIPAHAMYGSKAWGKVGVWESLATELKGWGDCSTTRAERYRTNFAHGPAVIADLNGDGPVEVVAVGNVYDCDVGHPPGKYNGVYVFNADRSRFQAGVYDWSTVPINIGAPLTEDYDVIENNQPNPAVADLDGDGTREIIYSSYDGRVHAFWLDRTEHGAWPYAVYTGGAYRFASEPAIADLDNDGHAEVIVASWVQKGTYQTGKLHILDYMGNPLHELDLPAAFGSPDWNGALAAPTLADIDGDADLEVVLNTAHAGFVAYDLPGTANARVLWGTGRGNYQRTGSILQGTLQGSVKQVAPTLAGPGDTLVYTIALHNPGPALAHVCVTDTLPAPVSYAGGLWASAGSWGQAGGVITWTGIVPAGAPVTITYGVTISTPLAGPQAIINTALLDDGLGQVWSRSATAIVNGYALYLPLVRHP